MRSDEKKLDQNTGYIAPVSADSSIAHVEDTKRKALAEKTLMEEDAAASRTHNNGQAEGNLFIDLGLEALGVKSAAALVQFADERMSDRAGMNAANNSDSLGGLIGSVAKTIDEEITGSTSRQPGKYEGLFERAQIAASSLDLDPKHVNTDVWSGTNTKLNSVLQTRDMSFRKTIEHDLLPQIRGVEMQHQAMLGHARSLAPGLSMSGPSINPAQLLGEAERMAEKEDWVKRTEGGAWA